MEEARWLPSISPHARPARCRAPQIHFSLSPHGGNNNASVSTIQTWCHFFFLLALAFLVYLRCSHVEHHGQARTSSQGALVPVSHHTQGWLCDMGLSAMLSPPHKTQREGTSGTHLPSAATPLPHRLCGKTSPRNPKRARRIVCLLFHFHTFCFSGEKGGVSLKSL